MLIIGCGYLGRRVARFYLSQGVRVWGLVSGPNSADALQTLGIEPLVWNLDQPLPPALELPLEGPVFYFAPPPPEGLEDGRAARFLDACASRGRPRRLVYVSTTGVYGDCAGAWVDESRPAAPQAARARRRFDAEQRFRAWRTARGGELVILRVAGIYGPGRLPLQRLRQRLPLVREEEAPFSNRIHIDDLVEVCVAAMQRGGDGEIYNVSDGHPSTMTDYFTRIADLTGLPRPPLIPLAEGERSLSPGMMSYMRESRRLSNRKMLRELAVDLRYPSLDSGLPACVAPSASSGETP